MTESSDRFPFPRPYGWFPVGRLDELPDEPVSSLRAQGTDLVLWRDDTAGDDESAWRVFDAYCPHLGAHLGVGGRVDGGCLVCPFHEWTFRADGRNAWCSSRSPRSSSSSDRSAAAASPADADHKTPAANTRITAPLMGRGT